MEIKKIYLLYRQSGVLTRHLFATMDEILAEKWKEFNPETNKATEFILVDGIGVEDLVRISDEKLFLKDVMEVLQGLNAEAKGWPDVKLL